MNNGKKSQKIVASAFIHKDGKLFVARRADTKKFLPGKYEIPGGHIEFGETMAEGLKREIMEELGVKVVIGDPYFVFAYMQDNDTVHTVEIDYFATLEDPNQEITLHPEDHSEYRWISQAEIGNFFNGNDEAGHSAQKGFETLESKSR